MESELNELKNLYIDSLERKIELEEKLDEITEAIYGTRELIDEKLTYFISDMFPEEYAIDLITFSANDRGIEIQNRKRMTRLGIKTVQTGRNIFIVSDTASLRLKGNYKIDNTLNLELLVDEIVKILEG